MTQLVLASSSPFRQMLMRNAGLFFEARSAQVDERALEIPLLNQDATPQTIALALARAKALDVARYHEKAVVIGCDQTLSLGNTLFHKAKTRAEAVDHLMRLSGQTHVLNSAIVLVQKETVIWEHVSQAHLTMRPLSPDFIDHYLDRVGDHAFHSVGAYQLESEGIHLFSKIEGDYFTILGLPLLPLLEKLRNLRMIDG